MSIMCRASTFGECVVLGISSTSGDSNVPKMCQAQMWSVHDGKPEYLRSKSLGVKRDQHPHSDLYYLSTPVLYSNPKVPVLVNVYKVLGPPHAMYHLSPWLTAFGNHAKCRTVLLTYIILVQDIYLWQPSHLFTQVQISSDPSPLQLTLLILWFICIMFVPPLLGPGYYAMTISTPPYQVCSTELDALLPNNHNYHAGELPCLNGF